ncbi:MAG TPA: IPTL-CTERM sorting domain-containing protein, partial [Gammaproteobacteria bacterium]|nr:IPTL-CTERM sorting domain-containing protein [Gammaproteobacteria bacterium]
TNGGAQGVNSGGNGSIQISYTSPVAAVSAIPTLSEWGVYILSVLLVILGLPQVRRRILP